MDRIKYFLATVSSAVLLSMIFITDWLYGQGSNTVPSVKIENPIKAESFPEFIRDILNIVVQIGAPIIVLGVIFSGFLFVKAQGSADKLKIAKEAFLYTLVGAGIVLGAFVIAEAIQGTVNQLG